MHGLCGAWRWGGGEAALRGAGGAACEATEVVWGFKDCGGSGARGYDVRARAPYLHFFTFMGLIFVKYWVIMQM